MKRTMGVLAMHGLLAAGLLFSVPGSVRAQHWDRQFFACYVPTTGTVYLIQEDGLSPECTDASHVGFEWTRLALSSLNPGYLQVLTWNGEAWEAQPRTAEFLHLRPILDLAPTTGQVLTWDGSAWTPAPPTGGGASDHGELTGLTDDDHAQYLLGNGTRATTNGFAVTGTLGTGTIPAAGPGVRLMWYPGKAAFRAGRLSLNSGDDAFIGQFSTALGDAATASGHSATALGGATVASGNGSTALGVATRASGLRSTALGHRTTASGELSTAMGYTANTNFKYGSFVYGDGTEIDEVLSVKAVAPNSFVVRAQRVWFGKSGNQVATAGRYIETSTGGFLSNGGTWVNSSDVNRKANFRDVSGADVLDRLARLPIRSWNYRAEDSTVRHLGPTAQDFHAAFHLGDDDKTIATVDEAGVALLAIQALERRTREQASEIAALRAELAALRADLARRR